MPTVWDVTIRLLGRLGLTTIVGNPGSTEEPFLNGLPEAFSYILALHEACVIAVADGLAQGLRAPVLVNVHTNAGLGNAMGNIVTAYANKTPLLITAGQQTRKMLLGEPFLTNVEAETLPRPWVKWSYEPRRPEDVPAAFVRAYLTAVQPPQGPVFLSLPMDDWGHEIEDVEVLRSAARRTGPDPDRLADFAAAIDRSANPVLVYGGDVARARAFDEAVALAEKLGAPVWLAPLPEQLPFPKDHPLFAGTLPAAIGPLAQALEGHDLVLVIGAPVFRYYPFVPGDVLPRGARLLHVTDDPGEAARAVVGDSLVSDAGLAIAALTPAVARREASPVRRPSPPAQPRDDVPAESASPLSAAEVFTVLGRCLPRTAAPVIVHESPSNMAQFNQSELGRRVRPGNYFMTASGGIGWAMPAGVGLALTEKRSGRDRPVVVILGDGSFQYSVQAIWTAVQQAVHVVFVVLANREYAILKAFAKSEKLSAVPGLDIPGIDCVLLGQGYGATAIRAETAEAITAAFGQALAQPGVTVIEIPIAKAQA